MKNFPEHDQFPVFLKIVYWCGFRIVLQKVLDAADRLPTTRVRWLAILQRIEDPEIAMTWEDWGKTQQSTAFHWDAWIRSQPDEAKLYQPTQQERQMFMDPALLPKYAPSAAKHQMLTYRVPSTHHKLPTFMACYGAHADLPMHLLQEKGLHGHFTAEYSQLRWWKPHEIVLLHSHLEPITLLAPLKQAWRTLGNCITIHHAYALFYHVMKHTQDVLPPGTLAQHLAYAESLRLKASSIHIIGDDNGCYMTKGNPAELQSKLKFFADSMPWKGDDSHHWPTGKFFDPMWGCIPIATVKGPEPMGLTTKVACPNARDCRPTVDEHVATSGFFPSSCTPNGSPSEMEADDQLTHLTSEPNRQPLQPKPGVTQPFAESLRPQPHVHSATDHSSDQTSPRIACCTHLEMAGEAPQPIDVDNQVSSEKRKTCHDHPCRALHSGPEHTEHADMTVVPEASACHDLQTPQPARPHTGDVKIHDFDDSIDIPDTKMDEDYQMPTADAILPDLTEVAVFLIPGTYGILQISHDVTYASMLSMWDFSLLPCTLLEKDRTLKLIEAFDLQSQTQRSLLAPAHLVMDNPKICSPEVTSFCILSDFPTGTIALPTQGQAWRDLKMKYPTLIEYQYDVYGRIPDHHVISRHTRVFKEQQLVDNFVNMEEFLDACDSVTMLSRVPIDTDILVVNFQGTTEALPVVLTYWHVACPQQWLKQHGRMMAFQVISDTEAQLLFRPDGTRFSTPMAQLVEAIQVRLLQTGFRSMNRCTGTVDMIVKYQARCIETIVTDRGLPIAPFLQILRHSLTLTAFGQMPAFVSGGKRHTEAATTSDLKFTTNIQGNTFTVCHIAHPIFGGAGSKQDHKQTVHAGIGSLLLELGVPLDEVTKHVERLQREYGIPKLTHILFGTVAEERPCQIQELCRQVGIPIEIMKQKQQRTTSKFQKLEHTSMGRALRNLDPSQYQLQAGFFTTQDGQSLPVHVNFSPCVSGITMVTPSQADHWLKTPGKIHVDEMGLFVVGDIDTDCSKLAKHTVPAVNSNGQPCLIAGYLVQLGEKPVCVHRTEGKEMEITPNEVQICSFTLWKDDFAEGEWKQITQSPVKSAKRILEQDGFKEPFNAPFGRTYHLNQKNCPPNVSTSVQFHAEIHTSNLAKILKRSGFNRLFIVPKDASGRPDPQWRALWLDLPVQQIEQSALPNPSAAGLIKGRRSLGLRVLAKNFETTWKQFFPDQPVPEPIPQGDTWKVQPLPAGMDRKILQAWGTSVNWEIHPLRPVGARAWLVLATEAPPKDILQFNSNPLIIKKLPSRSPHQTVGLVAGPMSKPSKVQTADTSSVKAMSVFRQGDPYSDPWNSWKPTTQNSPSAMASTAQQTGPTAAHLEKHDQQLKDLETAVQKLQVDQQQHTTAVDMKLSEMDAKLQVSHEETKNAFQSFRTDFESTLQKALGQQDQRLQTSMSELKDLFRSRDKRKTPARDEDDTDMER